MPIYEYTCQDCLTKFEIIRRIKDADATISCVHCNGDNVKRGISLFNAASGGRVLTGGNSCSTCSGSTCSTCRSN